MTFAEYCRSRTARASQFLKTTLLGGVVFLIPVIILAVVITKATGILHRFSRPMADALHVKRLVGVVITDVLAIALLLVGCFVAGLIARLSFASRFVKRAETGVLWRVPGYGLIKGLTDSLDQRAAASMRPVLAHFDDVAQLAFEVDRLADGRRVVYLPSSPDPRSGSLVVMEERRVEPVDISVLSAIQLLRGIGHGAGLALGHTIP